jgi:4,5-dihydroxyphthalate decarboxylase
LTAGRRSLALACWDYDRTRALADGRITPEGLDLVYISTAPEETFFRMMRHREFDAAELSLSSYVLSLDHEPPPFVAIPVFPSRAFRHSGVYVNAEAGISAPRDLAGGRVGVAEYQLTANVWIRGILAEHHDLPVDSVTYVTGGLAQPGRIEKAAIDLPGAIRVERAPEGRTLTAMLEAGELDAIYSPRAPVGYGAGRIVRLFPDWPTVEREYFRTTGIFPIMHVVAIRRELHESAPWIARSLVKAFEASLELVREELHEVTALKIALPWVAAHAEETERLMGPNPWRYGLDERNAKVLETFLRYSAEQGLAHTPREPHDLFVAESLERFAV